MNRVLPLPADIEGDYRAVFGFDYWGVDGLGEGAKDPFILDGGVRARTNWLKFYDEVQSKVSGGCVLSLVKKVELEGDSTFDAEFFPQFSLVRSLHELLVSKYRGQEVDLSEFEGLGIWYNPNFNGLDLRARASGGVSLRYLLGWSWRVILNTQDGDKIAYPIKKPGDSSVFEIDNQRHLDTGIPLDPAKNNFIHASPEQNAARRWANGITMVYGAKNNLKLNIIGEEHRLKSRHRIRSTEIYEVGQRRKKPKRKVLKKEKATTFPGIELVFA